MRPAKVRIEVLDRKQIAPVGGVGVGLTVVRADGTATAGPLEVSIDYSGFAHAYGGGFGSRLRLVKLPRCAVTTPSRAGCSDGEVVAGQRNDAAGQTVTATVSAAPEVATYSGMAALGEPTVYALTSGSSSDAGDYRATPMDPTGKWEVGLGSGAFTYQVPISVPKPPMGVAPDLALSYNSQGIDGRTSASNNQASWVGTGWDLNVGYVERRYKNCIEDGHGPDQNQQWGDLCWASPNPTDDPSGAVYNISLNGVTSQLVKDGTGDGSWHLQSDAGWKIQHLKGSPANPDNSDEFWVITTQDGTRYYFGWGRTERLNNDNVREPTRSVLTVPVIGDDPGEPCYNGGQPTYCNQAWRWNLDRVVTPNEVENSYFYAKETNYYRSVAGSDKARKYDAGSYLERIDYGWASQISGAQLPAMVDFQHVNRCVERMEEKDPLGNPVTTACPSIDSKPESYPDVPVDLICDGSSDDSACAGKTYYPTFFQRDLLWDIKVNVRDTNTSGWDLVQQYQMKYALMDPSGAVGDQLWLDYIQRRGYSGDDITLPTINFNGEWQDNKVGDGELNFRRVNKVFTDTGSTVAVTYGHATDENGTVDRQCDENNLPSQPENAYECFWQKWTPEGETEERTGWFKKFVVRQVDIDPGDAGDGDPMMTTTYEYDGAPGWRFTADPLVKDQNESWSDWRGYGKVKVSTGAQENAHATYHWLYRGLDGDRTSKTDPAATRSVAVKDSDNKAYPDSPWLAGQVLETSKQDDAGTSQERAWHEYWVHNTAQYTGLPDARFVRESATDTYTKISTSTEDKSTWRRHRVENEYDDNEAASTTFGLPLRVDDQGEAGVSDNQCTEYGRGYNTSDLTDDSTGTKRWMVYQDDERHYNVSCSAQATDQANGQDTLHLDRRITTLYDGATSLAGNDTALTDGNATEARTYTDATTYRTNKAEFDAAGRRVKTWDGKNKLTTTSYAPVTSWPVDGVKVTTPDPDDSGAGTPMSTTTYYSRFWGQPWKVVDPNGNETQQVFDAVGRLTKVFKPTEAAAAPDGHASLSYSYYIRTADSSTGVPDVAQGDILRVTSKAAQSATVDLTTVTYLDGLGRTREVQVPAPNGTGRTVTATRYDSSGNVAGSSAPFYSTGAVTDGPVNPAVSSLRSYNDVVVDWAGRTTLSQIQVNGLEQAAGKIVTTYTGADVTTVKPAVGQSTDTYTDVYGQKIKTVERNGSAGYTTTYEYTRKGELKYVHDSKGNTTHYTYNFPGQGLVSEDPDTGKITTSYDLNGNIETELDGNGQTVVKQYDSLDRLTTVSQGSTLLTQVAYDTAPGGKGQVASTVSHSGGKAYTSAIGGYDARGRVTAKTLTVPADGSGLDKSYTTSYHYDLADHLTAVDQPDLGVLPKETVTSTYDAYGLLRKVASPLATYLNNASYDDYGRLTSRQLGTSATGATVTRAVTYDDTRGTDWLKTLTSRTTTGSTTSTVQDDEYTRNSGGLITAVRENNAGQQQCYTYDDLRRLTGAWTTAATTCTTTPQSDFSGADPYQNSYGYDSLGNLQSVTTKVSAAGSTVSRDYHYPGYSADESTYTADTARPHAVTSVVKSSGGTDGYGYDSVGQLTSRTVSGVDTTLVWDALHRVSSVTQEKQTGDETSTYVHDAEGSVLLRTSPAENVLYLDGQEVHKTSTGLTATRYYNAGGASLAMRTSNTTTNGKLTWLLSDTQASSQLTVQATDGTVQRRRYKPFGEQRGSTALAAGTDRGFLGKAEDDSTGLSLLGARMYDASLGRFLSPDPLSVPDDPQSMSAYSYSNNDPVNFADPTGLRLADCQGGWEECGAGPNVCRCSGTPPTTASGKGVNLTKAAKAPAVQHEELRRILAEIYIKPGSVPEVGNGKVATALISELDTGEQTVGKWHIADAADQLRRLQKLLEADRKGETALTPEDRKIALGEAKEIFGALDHKDTGGKITQVLKSNSDIASSVRVAVNETIASPSMASITGATWEAKMYNGRVVGKPRLTNEPKLPRVMGALGIVGDLLFIYEGVKSAVQGDTSCSMGDCPDPRDIA
ncbi:RHS repeat domain-containing protein [Streptomyces sp. NPDC088747]|uniref:RHS repeat domain-containing protein n=1 Tax=Streptomyces sp. NPDC088747 TaxID=3365886 RepID=UPI0037FB066A